MANDNRKNGNQNQGPQDQKNGMRDPSREPQQGGNQQVSRDRDNQDRNKMGEQEGANRQPSSTRPNQDAAKGDLGNQIDDDQDELAEDVEVEDEDRITQKSEAQRGSRDVDSVK